ncbi:hypothetical protein [Brevibacillus massiliensis]|uniref:hypothetical protein n=1 Tax=Brevibacillus massiliensis TaxID=1118054 RepID=UPI0002F4A73C|nr:hypothetical protein [Brevibacillus massiliensis]
MSLQKKLDRAREEGRKEGYKHGLIVGRSQQRMMIWAEVCNELKNIADEAMKRIPGIGKNRRQAALEKLDEIARERFEREREDGR